MLDLNPKKDMGLEASLKLLDIPPDAGIKDANQAYTQLHRMIETYHQGLDEDDGISRQEDLDLLTCAYEKAVAHFSSRETQSDFPDVVRSASVGRRSDSLKYDDFTFDMPVPASRPRPLGSNGLPLESDGLGVEETLAQTGQQMKQAEASLPSAGARVDSATKQMHTAEQQLAAVREKRINAEVAARSAKTRARLLEIEANRAMEDAIAIAEKARQRVVEARRAARQADQAATTAAKQSHRLKLAENKAVAQVAQARQRLETAQTRARDLTHGLVDTRHRLAMLNRFAGSSANHSDPMAVEAAALHADSGDGRGNRVGRQAVLQDLLEIEATLKAGQPDSASGVKKAGQTRNRRRHRRLVYPAGEGPLLHVDGHDIAVLDMSRSGLRLGADADVKLSRFIRGSIVFAGRSQVAVTGKVVRRDVHGLGVKLVTRIGNHLLDQERERLGTQAQRSA